MIEEPSISDSSPDAVAPRPDIKARLRAQFEHWLDEMLEDEPWPQGLPSELLDQINAAPAQDCDLFTLFSGLTSLTGEIRLQGRAFKQLSESLSPISEIPARLDAVQATQRQAMEHAQQLAEETENRQAMESSEESLLPASKDVLAVVFDLYDRLQRGAANLQATIDSRASDTNLLGRIFAGKSHQQTIKAAEALADGYRLTLSRIDAALSQWGIERIGAVGEMFDPEQMSAVDVQTVDDADDGTILEVFSSGYILHETVLATARVKVVRSNHEGVTNG